jgi:hypothetical protein
MRLISDSGVLFSVPIPREPGSGFFQEKFAVAITKKERKP